MGRMQVWEWSLVLAGILRGFARRCEGADFMVLYPVLRAFRKMVQGEKPYPNFKKELLF